MSTPPPTYENYPPAWDAGVGTAGGGSGPQSASPGGLVSPPSRPTARRVVLKLIGAAAAVGVGTMAVSYVGAAAMFDSEDFVDGRERPGNEAEVGGSTVTWPDGWTEDVRTETQLVLTQSGATVIFRSYGAGDDATAADEAERLLKRHASSIGKQKTTSTSTPDEDADIETAGIEVTGVRGDGDRMDGSAYVALDVDGEALAVIALLPAKASEKLRREIKSMRRDFLDQLG